MCLIVNDKVHKDGEPKVAKKDIVCWKSLELLFKGGRSLIYKTVWHEGRVKFVEMQKEKHFYNDIENIRVNQGLHAFISSKAIFKFYKSKRMMDTSTTASIYSGSTMSSDS